jgi:hypothetical protein
MEALPPEKESKAPLAEPTIRYARHERLRKILQYQTPAEKFAQCVASIS